MGNHWNHAVVILRITEHAFLFKTVYQCHVVVRSQSLGCLACDGVGIGIEDIALSVVGQWSHHGGNAFVNQGLEHLAVGTLHVAYESEVNAVLQWALVTMNYVHIGTCQAEGVHAVSLKLGNQVLVDQTAINHGYHLQHICIGDATAVYHLALNAEGCGYLGGTASTAMHQYFLARNGCKILQEPCQLLAVFNDGTANLYYCYFFHIVTLNIEL